MKDVNLFLVLLQQLESPSNNTVANAEIMKIER